MRRLRSPPIYRKSYFLPTSSETARCGSVNCWSERAWRKATAKPEWLMGQGGVTLNGEKTRQCGCGTGTGESWDAVLQVGPRRFVAEVVMRSLFQRALRVSS